MNGFGERYEACRIMVEKALDACLPADDCPQGELIRAMSYSLLGAGKRVRAVFLLEIYRAVSGGDPTRALPFACAIEMIHAYSLIHDDLPCMDDDDMRRGKPSCHKAFGEATALLAGDALLTLAFESCTNSDAISYFGGEKAALAVSALAKAAGAAGMVGGQIIDLCGEKKILTAGELRLMGEKKTGELICATSEIACILAGAEKEVRDRLYDFTHDLGLSFQIRDDILDHTSTSDELGKPIGSDTKNEKSTYVSLYGLQGAEKAAAELSAGAKSALIESGVDSGFLLWMTDMLLDRKN